MASSLHSQGLGPNPGPAAVYNLPRLVNLSVTQFLHLEKWDNNRIVRRIKSVHIHLAC